MKTPKTYLLALLLIPFSLSLSSGCNSEKACKRKLAKIELKCPELFKLHDSIQVKTVVKETKKTDTLHLPGITDTFTVEVPCPNQVEIHHVQYFKGGSATLTIDSGRATVICHDDSLNEIISTLTDSVKYYKTSDISGMATQTVTIEQTHWYDYFCRCWFGLTAVVIAVWGAAEAVKRGVRV